MALSANASITRRNTVGMTRHAPVIATGSKIYQGSLVVLNASGTAQPAANDGTTTFIGIATAEVASGDGTLTAEVVSNCEIQITLKTGVTAAHVGNAAYAFDDAVVTNLTTRGAEVGTITEWESATSGWVMLNAKALRAGA